MTLKNRVGIRIKTLRQRRNLSQERLAELIDRSADAISQLERGVNLPGFDTLERLATGLSVPIRDFFDIEDAEVSPKRAALMTKLIDSARSLSDEELAVAVGQIEVLAARGKSLD